MTIKTEQIAKLQDPFMYSLVDSALGLTKTENKSVVTHIRKKQAYQLGICIRARCANGGDLSIRVISDMIAALNAQHITAADLAGFCKVFIGEEA